MVRYDVLYNASGLKVSVDVDRHFCRAWIDGQGCYGSNPDHGLTWREATEEAAKWHETQAASWREREEPRE